MFRKPFAAAVVFAATLLFSLGCPRQDASQQGEQPAKARGRATDKPGLMYKNQQPAPEKPLAKTPPQPIEIAAAPHASDDAPPGSSDPNPKTHDALFAGWPRPKALIVATGMQMGYIEPCGCSGKENQKGGLSRRHNMLKKLAADGWPLLPVDVGEQVRRFGKEAELKFSASDDALKQMGYQAVALGPSDLRLPAATLLAEATDVGNQTSPLVAANVSLFGNQDSPPRFRVVTAGGLKIGITAIVGAEFQKGIHNSDIAFDPAEKALADVLPKLKAAHCDQLLLLAEATLAESTALAKKFPEFDFVVTAGGAPEPPAQPRVVAGTKTWLIEVGQKGMYANAIGLFDDAKQPVRFQRIPLDAHWGESAEMKQVMASYQDQLQQLDLEGLGLKPGIHPSGREFVGSKKCADCHTKAYDIWKHTPHAKALDTLAHLDPPRNHDPECLSCHVTGWDPKRDSPYRGGYLSLEATPLLAHNGCENCHGPGSEHVDAESGNKPAGAAQIAALRAAMRVPRAEIESRCIQCHDGDNSLNFNFKTYWPKVEHKGKD